MTEIYLLSDFTQGLNEFQLKTEINSSLPILCLDVGRDGDNVKISFSEELSPENKLILNNLVTNHNAVPVPITPYLYFDNSVIKTDANDGTFSYLGMQPDEIHISKTSQTHYPSIKAAIQARNESNIIFIVHPGVYIEDNPLILPEGCCLIAQGNSENTFIIAQNSASDIIQVGIKCKIEGLTLVGGARGIYFDGTQSNGASRFTGIFQCFIVGCQIGVEVDGKDALITDSLYMREILIVSSTYQLSKGIYCHSGGQVITSGLNIAGNSSFGITDAIYCVGDRSKVSMTTSSIWLCSTGIFMDNNAEVTVQLLTCKYNEIALNVGANGTSKINGDLFNAVDSLVYDINIQGDNAVIDIQSGSVDILKIHNPNNVKINARFQSTQFETYYQNLLGNVVFGTKRVPAKLAIGQGTYDIDGVRLLTNDNLEIGEWTDCTLGAITSFAPPFNIFSTSVGSCFYVGRDENPVGIKILINSATQAPVSKNYIAWEYWNGSDWISFKVSERSTSNYNDNHNSFISAAGKYQIRFGLTSSTPLVNKVLNGIDKRWIRARLLNNISTVPIAEYCKLHVNSTEINSDGFNEYYGNSRPISSLKWNYSGATETDLFLNENISLKGNTLVVGSQLRLSGYIPADADSSFPLKMKLSLIGTSESSGIVKLILRVGNSNLDSNVYLTSTGVGTQISETEIEILQKEKEYRVNMEVDISDFLINPVTVEPDLIWLVIERDTDTYGGNIIISHLNLNYVKMLSGNHLLNY